MPTLEELFSKYNITPSAGPTSGPRTKLLAQAVRMLKELKGYTSERYEWHKLTVLVGAAERIWSAPCVYALWQ